MFDRYLIEEFTAIGAPGTWSAASRGNGRSVLFRVAEALLGPEARTPRLIPLAAAAPTAPYSRGELAAFRSWADTQPTDNMRRDATTLVALGAGGGLATEDILPVRRRNIVEHDGVLVVEVPGGRRPRVVPVLADWSTSLERSTSVLHPDDYAFRPGRDGEHKNGVNSFITSTAGINKPNSQRLRATWIVHHLTAGTPVKAVLAAAGVQSLEALTRYLRFVPDLDPAESVVRLRGELRQ